MTNKELVLKFIDEVFNAHANIPGQLYSGLD